MEKVCLDKSKCMGCGACVAISNVDAGGNFTFDDEGLSELVNDAVTETSVNACETCPMGAIEIKEVNEGEEEK